MILIRSIMDTLKRKIPKIYMVNLTIQPQTKEIICCKRSPPYSSLFTKRETHTHWLRA
uniref:Uncharacterized protein n=1 Tax=Lepeophtheirus salmonis TaxID=72036 RepID=A0A0K2UY70_LEPSM